MKKLFNYFITVMCLLAMSATMIGFGAGVHIKMSWSLLQIIFWFFYGLLIPGILLFMTLSDKSEDDGIH